MKKIVLSLCIFVVGILNCNATTDEKYYKTIYENGIYSSFEISEDEFNKSCISAYLGGSYVI